MVKSDTGPLFSFFGRTQKRCHASSKMMKRDTGPLFVIFVAHSKAVSTNNGEDRALVKHGNARAGERHQLVGHQMNEQVRHRPGP